MKLLTRKGVLVEEQGSNYVADSDGDSDEARVLRPLQAAACAYRIAFGPRAGPTVLTVQGAIPRDTDFKQPLCADIQGLSLHAAVRCGADDCQALDQRCRYIRRPALANERVQTNAAGQVVLKRKTPWREGTTHLAMSPLELTQRLAALVPRPRLHLIRFHGGLAHAGGAARCWVARTRSASRRGALCAPSPGAVATASGLRPSIQQVSGGPEARGRGDRLRHRFSALRFGG